MEQRTDQARAIAVRGLIKTFGGLTAVDGISFDVREGEVFGILGPNGAGKTTTLECIEGLQQLTAGSIEVLGLDSQRDAWAIKERIGVQLQTSAFFDYLNLTEILKLFASFYPRSIPADDLLARMELQDKAKTQVKHLSGGQKQRFSVAVTLVSDPELLFLDEPTTGLDPQARRHMWGLVQAMHEEGRTIVLTTHSMEEAQFLCERVAIMDLGRIAALDTPANLVRALDAPYEVRASVGDGASHEQLGALPGVIDVRPVGPIGSDGGVVALRSSDATVTVPALLSWAEDRGERLADLEVRPATLEDVFLALTGRELRE
ncbi:MAG: ABC transporter ATP-binding protein [Chloroflexi bacterium]|nr:ABC transporter ATP-binding protein [Chloroflexota bacterium]